MAHPESTEMFTTETVLVSEKDEKTLVETSSASVVSSMDDASSTHRSTKKRSIADLRRGFKEGARNTAVSLRRPDMLAKKAGKNTWRVLKNYAKFVGPGFMVRISIADTIVMAFNTNQELRSLWHTSTQAIMQLTLLPELHSGSVCSSSYSCPTSSLSSCKACLSSSDPSLATISLKHASTTARDGSTSLYMSLRKLL